MPTRKYDYPALKLEYFNSDYEDIFVFMQRVYGKDLTRNGTLAKAMKGRSEEKRDYKEKIIKRAMERNMENQAKQLEVPVDILMKAKKMALGKIIKMISESELNMNDLSKGLEKIKTELGEPSTISNNINLNTVKADPELTKEDEDFLSLLVEKRYGKKGRIKNKDEKQNL